MWYPNKRQWTVIWTAAAAIIAILVLRLQELLYMDRGIYMMAIVLIAGALLLWQLSDRGGEGMKMIRRSMHIVRLDEKVLSLTMPEGHIADHELNEAQLEGFIGKYEFIGESYQGVMERVSRLGVGETVVFQCMSKI